MLEPWLLKVKTFIFITVAIIIVITGISYIRAVFKMTVVSNYAVGIASLIEIGLKILYQFFNQ